MRAVEYIKIFGKLLDFVKAHIKRQLYFVDRCHDSNFNFFAQAFTAPQWTCLWAENHHHHRRRHRHRHRRRRRVVVIIIITIIITCFL